ncbi:MAG: transketolase C-terminal domain-containing protein, partial [Aeromicrobium sp.]
WDLSLLQLVPGLHLAAPRDGSRLRELLREAVAIDDAPSVVRFAKGPVAPDLEAVDRVGTIDVLHRSDDAQVLVVGVGTMAAMAVDVAQRLEQEGVAATAVDPRWIKPLDPALLDLAAQHRLVVTIEDNGRQGGVGSTILHAVSDRGLSVPVRIHAVEQEFLDHAKRDVILKRLGLTAESITHDALARIGECPEGDQR